MQANLVLESTDTGGKKQTTTITYLRPSQKSHATELATALNALTTNTYVGAKVNEINVDLTPTKQIPTLALGEWQEVTGTTTKKSIITYNGDGVLATTVGNITTQDGIKTLTVSTGNNGVLYATEGTNYSSAAITFTVN